MALQRVRFPAIGEQPPALEGELWLPDDAVPASAVVIAHPHPQRGGNMNNNVVAAIGEGLRQAGIGWLRFNFRGVGQSEGRYGEGVTERDDVLGALAFLAEQPGVAPDRIGLAGYSFGARVSLAVAPTAAQVRALLCVAPPLREPLPAAAQPSCPFRVLIGDRDGNAAEGVERYAAFFGDPGVVQVVAGTDHFWRGYEPVLVEAAHSFFVQTLAPGAPVP